jgi:putative Mn2+ efflux pump MntP
MSYFSIIILAIVLSIDAFVVSFSYGLIFRTKKLKNSLLLAGTTGFFQFFMPIIGYFFTGFVKTYIDKYAHILIFAIFTYLGIKFIIEAFEKKEMKIRCLDAKCLILAGIATSIDAFSAGISLSLLGNKIFKPAVLTGVVTFVNSILGFYLGEKIKHMPTRILEILAGIVLILMGIKALF